MNLMFNDGLYYKLYHINTVFNIKDVYNFIVHYKNALISNNVQEIPTFCSAIINVTIKLARVEIFVLQAKKSK